MHRLPETWSDTSPRVSRADLGLTVLAGRVFASHALKVHAPRALPFACTCSRDKKNATLTAIPRDELLDPGTVH